MKSYLYIFIFFFITSAEVISQENKLAVGLGVTYGFDKFNEDEIREVADDFNLLPYSSPVYEHLNTTGISIWGKYILSDNYFADISISYLKGFKSSYTIFDIMIDYEKAYFESDLLSLSISPGLVLKINDKSDLYLSAGFGILYRKLEISQEARGNKLVIENINSRREDSTAPMSSFQILYIYNAFNKFSLFLKGGYNIGFGELSRSNFIAVSAGAAYSI